MKLFHTKMKVNRSTCTVCEIGLFTEDVGEKLLGFGNFTYVIVMVYLRVLS